MFVLKERSTYLQLQAEKDSHLNPNYNFVKRIVDRQITEVMRIIDSMDCDNVTETKDTEASKARFCPTFRPLGLFKTEWPTCGTLNSINGLQSVEEESKIWNQYPLLKDWVHHADFISLHRAETNYVYTFEVQWSIPTPAYPVPQAIVSVFFNVSVNFAFPHHFPVNVTYTLEGHQFAHSLNTIFRPKWLYDVLDMKTMMFKTFDF